MASALLQRQTNVLAGGDIARVEELASIGDG
jgi:hypothetical protein